MSENKPHIAQKAPYAVEVEAGKSYWYCTCGKSAGQPFCDGSRMNPNIPAMMPITPPALPMTQFLSDCR